MFQIFAFINYWLKQVDKHSLHSPFLFEFYTKVLSVDDEVLKDVEALRKELLNNKEMVEIKDFGAGSRVYKGNKRTIASIAKYASTPKRFSQFILRLIQYYQLTNIVELGTSLGLNTLYLSENSKCKVLTFEGDPTIARLAEAHFKKHRRSNIKTVVGNIDQTLEPALKQLDQVDLAYLDANHKYKPTLEYYDLITTKTHDQSIVIVDDIHWSKEMSSAWEQLKTKPEVTLSVDVFEAGILFFNPKLEKEEYVLKF